MISRIFQRKWPFGAHVLFIPASSYPAWLVSKDKMEMGDVFFSNRDWVTSFIHPHPTGNRELESKVLLDGREWSVCVSLCVSTSEAVFLTFSLLTWGLLESKTHLNTSTEWGDSWSDSQTVFSSAPQGLLILTGCSDYLWNTSISSKDQRFQWGPAKLCPGQGVPHQVRLETTMLIRCFSPQFCNCYGSCCS